jgi:hypothetical protein
MLLIIANNYDDHGLRAKVIEYLEAHPDYGKNKPYMCYRNGKIYTLEDIRQNVDGELDKVVRKMIMLALDLLTRGKRFLEDIEE